jgi:type I restriction enzyme S subunit
MKLKQFKFHELVSKTPNIRGIPTNEYKEQGRFPVIDQGNKFIAGYSDNEHALYKDTLPVVVFGDHTLAIKYLDFPFSVGADGTQLLKPNTDVIIGKFLYYAIINLNIQSLGYSRHFKVLKKSIFYVPDIEEQHRIVKILDLAQSLIEKRKQAISYLDDYIKAVFLDMFGDPVSNPKGWRSEFIGSICKVTKLAGYEYTKYIKYGDKGEIIMIRGLNVKQGKIKLDNIKWIKKEVSDLLDRSKLFVGDVVMTYIGVNIGDVAIITENDKYHLAPNVSKITPLHKNKLNSFFLLYFLMFNRTLFSQFTTNTAKQALNMGSIRKLKILIPDLPQQERFVEIVQKAELLKQKMQSQLKELENNFQAELQRAFRGE